jgi:hypothetical protein
MATSDQSKADAQASLGPGGCCCGDPYTGLPADVRPRPVEKKNGLRQATCPRCGLVYFTNRVTDVCIRCEAKEPP